ncbi:MAG: hypothetical protein ACR2MO_12080 [Acidimicrobiales bacterium]
MIKEMAQIAAECVKTPGRMSIWSDDRSGYVCVDSAEGQAIVHQAQRAAAPITSAHPGISPQFKLVFLTAAGGTVLFIALCLILSLIAGKDPPPLFEKVILGFFDLAKISFGAIVGLLGGKKLQGTGDVIALN